MEFGNLKLDKRKSFDHSFALFAAIFFFVVLSQQTSAKVLVEPAVFDQPITEDAIAAKSNSKTIAERFKNPGESQPDFQRHVAPLLGRLGCNGRACHGSFQGQGGFQLSLFGYDFSADHKSLMDGRVDVATPVDSLVLTTPTDEENHEGGLRYEVGSWQYNLLRGWVEAGAKTSKEPLELDRLIVEPSSLRLSDPTKKVSLKATAHWADGTVEDVTQLCRFETNDASVADVSEIGIVSTSGFAGDTHVVISYDNAVVPVPVVHPYAGAIAYQRAPTPTRIDELVVDKLEQLAIQPAELSDDAMFLRRVCLDITGTLPSPDEIREFLGDENPNKRRVKIDQLLETPAYAAWWTTFFCDMTENNSRQLRDVFNDVNAVSKQWYSWIYKRVENNVGYDEMVEGIVLGTSRREGEGYTEYCERMSEYFRDGKQGQDKFAANDSMPYYWMRREFQKPEERAIGFAHTFLGLRIQCAQCHKHPFDQWSQNDFNEFSKFFAGVTYRKRSTNTAEKKEEAAIYKDLGVDYKNRNKGNVRKKMAQSLKEGKTLPFYAMSVHAPRPDKKQQAKNRKNKKKNAPVASAKLLGSDPIDLTKFDDVRQPVMEWMKSADNPYFAKALVNRVWARYFGVGIVDPADDLNLANPASNAPLLNYLATEFVAHDYDVKWLHREIANSRTYQLSWECNETNENDRRNFSRALPRRLPAEVVFDAVNTAASSPDRNREFRNDVDQRAISIPGTIAYNNKGKKRGVNSSFAMQVFGRSERSSSCDCDRSEETSLIQTVYLKNDRDIHVMLTQKGSWLNQLVEKQRSQSISSADQNKLKGFEKRMKQLRGQIAKIESSMSDANENQKAKRTKQLANVRKQLKAFAKKAKPLRESIKLAQQQASESKELDLAEFVEEAYLRTLSRFPSKQETQRCVDHIEASKDFVNGVTGVMWALVNTKEFIVNH